MGLSILTDIKGVSAGVGFAGKIKNILAFKVSRNIELQLLIDSIYYNIYFNHYFYNDMGLGIGFKF